MLQKRLHGIQKHREDSNILSSRVNSHDLIPSPPVFWAGGEGQGEEGVHDVFTSQLADIPDKTG